MPVYNEEKYIVEAIESLLSQTYKDFTFFISDNNSTDKTSEICQNYAKEDKRIIYIKHPKNKGSFFNFKYVLDRANTPFFMFCGGHDKWHPQFIEKLLPIIERENLALVYPKSQEIKIDGTVGEIYEDNYTTTEINKSADRYLYFLRRVGKCNIFHGIWRTRILKNCYLKPVVGFDIIILAHAALMGKFKQQKDIFFFRRTVRKEKNKYLEQISRIIGKQHRKNTIVFLLKSQFIFENIRMLYQKNSSISIASKLLLSIKTIHIWAIRFYIKPFSIKIIKKILPNKFYLILKNKIKTNKHLLR